MEERNYEKMADVDLINELEKAKEIEKPEESSVLRILNPSTDAKKVKMVSFNQVKTKTMDYAYLGDKFKIEGPNTNRRGMALGSLFTQTINGTDENTIVDEGTEQNRRAVNSLIKRLQDDSQVRFLSGEVTLRGYMFEKGEQWRELYFWNGKADAIALDTSKNRFVIVEWKVKEKGTPSDHLPQAWVYAKLLKSFLKLNYLPSILIVLIKAGDKVDAGLFTTSADDNYEWSAEKPDLTKEIQPGSELFCKGLHKGKLEEGKLLKELFAESATLKHLKDVFRIPDLKVVPKHNNA